MVRLVRDGGGLRRWGVGVSDYNRELHHGEHHETIESLMAHLRKAEERQVLTDREMEAHISARLKAENELGAVLQQLNEVEAERDRLRELLRIAYRHLGAGEHDCTGPEECWTCAVREVLGEGSEKP